MRAQLTQAVHLNQNRRRLQQQLKRGEGDLVKLREQLEALTDQLLTLLLEELVHQSRDIQAVSVRARRPY